MGRNWVRSASSKTAIAGLVTVLALWGSVAPASAERRLVGNSYVIYVSKDGGNALLISGPHRVNKATYDSNKDAAAAGVVVRGNPLTDRYWSGSGSIGYNGSTVQVRFSDHASGPGGGFNWPLCGWTCDDYIDGNSHIDWWGASPYYATSMELKDRIWEDGCVLSVTIPGGVGWSVVTSGEVDWDTGRIGNNDIWYINHYYNNIHFSTACGRWNLSHASTGDAWFGYSFYSTGASGSTTPP